MSPSKNLLKISKLKKRVEELLELKAQAKIELDRGMNEKDQFLIKRLNMRNQP